MYDQSLAEAATEFTTAVESKVAGLARRVGEQGELLEQMGRPLFTESKADRAHHAAFREFLKHGEGARKAFKEASLEAKVDTTVIGTALAGGVALPRITSQSYEFMARTVNPWLDPAVLGATPVGSSDYRDVLILSDGTASRAAELGSRSQTQASNFRGIAPVFGDYYAYIYASKEARDDIPALESLIAIEAGRQIGSQLAADIVAGSGSSGQIKGLTSTAPVTTSDSASPMRASNTIQYVPSQSLASPVTAPTVDDVSNLLGAFQDEYLMEPSFALMMRPSVYRTLLRYANTKEAPHLMPRNPTLFGMPVRFTGATAAIGTNTFPILAGAWKRAYTLVQRSALQVILDPITTPGTLKFIVGARFGGIPKDNNGAKCFKCATS